MAKPKKEEILKACLEEFAAYGYAKANTNHIAEKAGVSKGLLFHYFGSKEKLFLLVFEQCVSEVMHCFDGFSVGDLPFLEATLAYSEKKAMFFTTHPLHYQLIIQAFYHPPEQLKETIAQRYGELSNESMSIIDQLLDRLPLKEGVSKKQAMEMIGAVSKLIEGKYVAAIIKDPNYSPEFLAMVKAEYVQFMRLALYGMAEEVK